MKKFLKAFFLKQYKTNGNGFPLTKIENFILKDMCATISKKIFTKNSSLQKPGVSLSKLP